MKNEAVKITCRDGRSLFASGKAFLVSGHRFVVHVSIHGNVRHNGWSVTCAVSVLSLLKGYDTQRQAIEASYSLATRIDNEYGPGAFSSKMDMFKDGSRLVA